MKTEIRTSEAPAPIGPYSQGVVMAGPTLFVAGQTPKDPVTGSMPSDFRTQAERTLQNVKAIVEAAGATMADVVCCSSFNGTGRVPYQACSCCAVQASDLSKWH